MCKNLLVKEMGRGEEDLVCVFVNLGAGVGVGCDSKIQILNFWFLIDSENKLWFQPECTGGGSDDQVGPSPRAFHIAVAIDCHMFIFGGRYGSKRFVHMLYFIFAVQGFCALWLQNHIDILLMMRMDFQVG